MTTALPTTIPEYLEHLRKSLAGADPALVQDALYDAEEYLRSELAENPGRSEAEVIAAVASSYGAPDEVAEIYRDTEAKVETALRAPPPRPRRSLAGRFFGVVADPRSLCGAVLHAAGAGHRHLLFHLDGDRAVAVGGSRGADRRGAVRDPVLRLGAGAVAGRGPHRRGDAGRAHAAPSAVRQPRQAAAGRASARCSPIRAPGPPSSTSC